MQQSLINKIRSHRHANSLLVGFAIVIVYLSYQIYVWANTQSTDNAYIEAEISNVSAEVSGVVAKVLVKENNFVDAGQVIAQIKDNIYKAQLAKADAALDLARRNIEIIEQNIRLANIEQHKAEESYQFAEENFKVSKSDYKRTEELSKDNYASKKNLDNAKITFERTKSDLALAEFSMQASKEKLSLLEIERLAAVAKLNTAIAEHELALRDLNNTTIKSPIKGMIGNSSLMEGNYVRPGVVLFSVVPIDELYIEANFKETQISRFKAGMKVDILVDSEKDAKIEGTIRNISPATGSKFSLLPPANATGNFTKIVQRVPVLIDFKVPESINRKVVPGMSVFVKVRTDQ
ncbi:MAG: HlyD family secretion protein [Rickettsiaceae bacterium]